MEMADEKKRLIRVRSEKSARFKRDGTGKKKQIADSWRKPRGLHSKKRIQKKAKGPLPSPGFGSPVAVKGMHPSGFREVLVFTSTEMGGLDPGIHAVRIGASVGNRKRLVLQEQAMAAGLKVLNPRDIPAKGSEADEE
jgi:large subunit ribosomal protein L32e